MQEGVLETLSEMLLEWRAFELDSTEREKCGADEREVAHGDVFSEWRERIVSALVTICAPCANTRCAHCVCVDAFAESAQGLRLARWLDARISSPHIDSPDMEVSIAVFCTLPAITAHASANWETHENI